MYTKQFFKDGDLLNAEKLNHIEDGIVEIEDEIDNKDYAYKTLMNNATFERTGYHGGTNLVTSGKVYGHALFNISKFSTDTFNVIVDNGVEKQTFEASAYAGYHDNAIFFGIPGFDQSCGVDQVNETEYDLSIPTALYDEREGEVKVTVLQKISDEKVSVNDQGYPINRPLVLDATIDYTHLPYVGDEALQAILDGRQILIKVPNANGQTLYANYMPVFQYQLPDQNNSYLTLLYMKDGLANNLVAALGSMMQGGQPDFSTVYGQLDLPLSKTYTETPLK